MKRDSFDQKNRKLGRLYEGKAKILYTTASPDTIIQRFKDHATAFNGQKKEKRQKKRYPERRNFNLSDGKIDRQRNSYPLDPTDRS